MSYPHLLVFSSLFPNPADANSGIFIRERMFRVAMHLPIVVVSPKPWFPGEGLIRLFRPKFRPRPPRFVIQQGISVYYPRFLSVPGYLKCLDGFFMALGSIMTAHRIKKQHQNMIIDAHFAYPDGYAATLLGKWLKIPMTVTLRGSEASYAQTDCFRSRIKKTVLHANRVFSVSESLRQLAISLGADPKKSITVSNAVDSSKFVPQDRIKARERFNLPYDSPVLISVGWLVEGKGFHRVIECIPELHKVHPNLIFLIVGEASAAGSMEAQLKQMVHQMGLDDSVLFLGPMKHEELSWALSAADVFVLATRREGWANVLLEAMSCGLPVITTDVGGNKEVVTSPDLGEIVPFGNKDALLNSLSKSLSTNWDRDRIRAYAICNSWDSRVNTLVKEFQAVASEYATD